MRSSLVSLPLALLACSIPAADKATINDDDESWVEDSGASLGEEVCDDADNDGDGEVDEDALDATRWYTDADGDGHGDPTSSTQACDAPEGMVASDDDCDDTDAAVSPEAAEVWYNGVDDACDGGDDYDQDEDGDPLAVAGGGDCDDTDPSRYTGEGCRPPADCATPPVSEVASYAGISDIAVDDACTLIASTVVSGPDAIYLFSEADGNRTISGYDNWDITALGVRGDGATWVAHTNDTLTGIGEVSAYAVTPVAEGAYLAGDSPYTNVYIGRNSSSLVVDDTCVWAPNLNALGEVVCVDVETYEERVLVTVAGRVEGIDLTADGILLLSVGAELWWVDPSSGGTKLLHTFAAEVLDLVVDYDDTVYVETTAAEIVSWDGAEEAVFASGLVGQGKLAITPDTRLIRVAPNPTEAPHATDEWELP